MKRDEWLDHIKIISCAIVVLSHFLESMIKSGILENGFLISRFLVFGHVTAVQLFFMCSGFLYQKYSRVNDFLSWKRNVKKKLIMLGIPYFFFAGLTWLLKFIFPGSVNQAPEGLLTSLFVHPIGQYWYLYILFFMFVITPTIRNRRWGYIMAAAAVLMRLLSILSGDLIKVYLIGNILEYEFWFAAGMVISLLDPEKIPGKYAGVIAGAAYLILSTVFMHDRSRMMIWGQELLACACIALLFYGTESRNMFLKKAAAYTMPVFLMHTIAATLARTILIRAGIAYASVHIVFGLAASFIGPVLAAMVLEKLHLGFLINPRPVLKYVK